jgi:protein-tyrosine kinase
MEICMSRISKALEKAKAARESLENFPETDFLQPAGNDNIFHGKFDRGNMEIKPEYTRTRVMQTDPDYLHRHRIVSILQDNRIADQIKILRTQVMDRMKSLGGNTLLVTSANSNEGKTLIALNLAISLSQEVGQTVLLVEADMRTSSIDHFLGLSIGKGLSDVLTNKADIPETLINPGIDKLVILPAGRSITSSAELLGSPRMESIVNEMKIRYPDRFIIFDGPPMLSFADPLVFSRFIDGILLVVEAEKTSKKDIAKVMTLLKDKPVIGAIYNKAKG